MSRRPTVWALSALMIFGAPVLATGCGDDAPPPARRKGGGKAKKAAAVEEPVRGASPDLAKLPAKFQNANWDGAPVDPQILREARDPFRPYVDDLLPKPPPDETGAPAVELAGRVSDSEVAEMQLIAVITGAAVAKAMLTDSRGLGHTLRVGDIVGLKEPFRVARITRNEVLFRPLRSNPDEPIEDVTKVLLSQDELQELRP